MALMPTYPLINPVSTHTHCAPKDNMPTPMRQGPRPCHWPELVPWSQSSFQKQSVTTALHLTGLSWASASMCCVLLRIISESETPRSLTNCAASC